MKRLTSLFLALMLMLALCACGTAPGTTYEPTEPTESTEVTKTTEPTRVVADTFETGAVTGNSYENKSLGIGITFDDDWYMYSEEELLELIGVVADRFEDEEAKEIIQSSAVYYEMVAQDTVTGTSINITAEKVTGANVNLTADEYINAAMSLLSSQLESAGMTLNNSAKVEVNFVGNDESAILLNCTMDGVEFTELLVVIKCGNYFVNITMTAEDEASAYALADMFYAL